LPYLAISPLQSVNRLGPHRPLHLHLGMFESEYHNGHSCHLLKCFQNWFSRKWFVKKVLCLLTNNHNDERLDLYYKLCDLIESLHIKYHLQVKEIAHTHRQVNQGGAGKSGSPLIWFLLFTGILWPYFGPCTRLPLPPFFFLEQTNVAGPLFSESLEPPLTQKSQKIDIPVLYRQTSHFFCNTELSFF
jgi:hypothetical protein